MTPKFRMFRSFPLLLACAALAVSVGWGSPTEAQRLPVLGPEIILDGGAGCPVGDPRVAPFGADGGEVWVWRHGGEVEAALFAEDATVPQAREVLDTGVESAVGLGHNDQVAWAAWFENGRIELAAAGEPGDLEPGPSGSLATGAVSAVEVATAADGRSLVAWHHPPGALLRSSDINVQLIDASGSAVGNARTVATLTDPLPSALAAVPLPDGSFVVTYTDRNPLPRIVAHRVTVDGGGVATTSGPVIIAETSAMGPSPSDVLSGGAVAARPGGVIFAWVEDGPAQVENQLAWRLYDFTLGPVTPKRILAATPVVGGLDNPPAVAAADNGDIALVWETADALAAVYLDPQGVLKPPSSSPISTSTAPATTATRTPPSTTWAR